MAHHLGDVDALRAMGHTMAATDAMAGLAKLGNGAVVADEEGPTATPVLGIALALLRIALYVGQVAVLNTFIIMREDGRDVQPVGAGHTVVALVAGNGIEVIDVLGYLHEEGILFFRDGFQRSERRDIVA